MMRTKRKLNKLCVLLSLGMGLLCSALYAERPKVELLVQADNVNLRAKPDMDSEVVGQLNYDSTVIAVQLIEDWVQIEAPAQIDLWIHGDMLAGDKVKKTRVNVRTGPGINYSVMGSLNRNEGVVRRGEFNEWVKIAPPRDTRVWIHRQFLKILKPETPGEPAATEAELTNTALAEPLPGEAEEPEVKVIQPVKEAIKKPAPPAPSKYDLIPLEGQGSVVRQIGRLESYLIASESPSKYFLVNPSTGKTVCFLDSDFPPIKKYKHKRVIVQGYQYWLQGENIPVIVPQAIVEINKD